MGKRNYIEEILSIRIRNELNPRWGGALIQLQTLDHAIRKAKNLPPEMVRYFPIAMVATIKGYFRSAIKELVDFGPLFRRTLMASKSQEAFPSTLGPFWPFRERQSR
jgi:hypothetical protein